MSNIDFHENKGEKQQNHALFLDRPLTIKPNYIWKKIHSPRSLDWVSLLNEQLGIHMISLNSLFH